MIMNVYIVWVGVVFLEDSILFEFLYCLVLVLALENYFSLLKYFIFCYLYVKNEGSFLKY